MMQRSAEVRWFFAGAVPHAMRNWFLPDGSPPAFTRTDEYLAFPTANVGVKFRQGNLEIKSLIQNCGVHTWDPIAGRVQTWMKWAESGPELAGFRKRVIRRRSLMIAVTKARSLRRFSFDRGVHEIAADTTRFPADGCNVELTDIRLGRTRHWTFGFEAFARAHPRRITDVVHETAARLFDERAPPASRGFAVSNSLSYPEWLLTLRVPAHWRVALSAAARPRSGARGVR